MSDDWKLHTGGILGPYPFGPTRVVAGIDFVERPDPVTPIDPDLARAVEEVMERYGSTKPASPDPQFASDLQPAPIPVAEYWQGVFQRNDPAELERVAAAYNELAASIGAAHDREETAPESAGAPNVPTPTQPPADSETAPSESPAPLAEPPDGNAA
jgi:hypothetical protein